MGSYSNIDLMNLECCENTSSNLINALRSKGIIQDDRVTAAMTLVDRADFTSFQPYNDAPQGTINLK